jgi:cation:H+ antiporter
MLAGLSTSWLIVVSLGAASVVVLSSIRATVLADVIADRTRMGEAVAGAVVLGAATSLAGIVVSVSAAWQGDASYAVSNAVGGIAAQTLFLALADLYYRGPNLEHAAAEPANLFQTVLLIGFLSLPIAAMAGPDMAFSGVHPASVVMVIAYIAGIGLTTTMRDQPMWRPVKTTATREDAPDNDGEAGKPVRWIALRFAGLVALMGLSGWVISEAGTVFITRFGLSSSLVGALGTAVVTSLPELVTTLTAVRRGALQLAVGGIIGGNTFDTLFLVFADLAYRDGSIYHAAGANDLFWMATDLLMTVILLAGLILRQREGPARIGGESVLMILVYATAVSVEIWARG